MEGDLDAVQEQYRSFAAQSEVVEFRMAQLEKELQESHAATADAQHFRGEAQNLVSRCRDLESALTEAVRKANALESEQTRNEALKARLEEMFR